jgi:hypothetical protein
MSVPFYPQLTTRPIFGSRFRWLAGMIVAISSTLSVPDKALASCGDYLHQQLHAQMHLTMDSNDLNRSNHRNPSPQPISRCSKGECSSVPVQSPVTPSKIIVVRKQSADYVSKLCFGCMESSQRFVDDGIKKPSQPSLDIADPPPKPLCV